MYELYNNPEIEALQQEIVQKRMKIVELLKATPTKISKRYTFTDWEEFPIHLEDLFGDKKDLIILHNMGKSCRYCTLWADGVNGVEHHLSSKVAFYVVTPDTPQVQKEFAASRGWKFTMLSDLDREFSIDMGFGKMKDGKYYPQPGYSTFQKQEDGTITRIGYDEFGPGDMYAGIWHMFDLLGEGTGDWEPQYSY